MSVTKIGINGIGRIGRTILRELILRQVSELEVVAVNNPGDIDSYAHLIKYDSVHGVFPLDVRAEDGHIVIGNRRIRFYDITDPSEIPWASTGAEIVIDATGRFKDKAGLGKHLRDTVKKVIMCAPGKKLDATFVIGINHETYDRAAHHIISNASCTTNCLSPVAKVLHDKWGIVNGFMTTVHSYTQDQALLDGTHSDLRRARAAALSMIPTTTGAAKAVGEVIPELKGKLDGYAVRVPTPNVSLVDLTATLKSSVTIEEINRALKEASEGPMQGILAYIEEELVSQDFRGRRESSLVDAHLTNVINGNLVKVVAWYDNEVGFSNRVIDLARYVGERL